MPSLNSKKVLRDHDHHHHAHDFFVIGFWGRATSTVTGRLKHPSQSADAPVSGGVLPARDKKTLKGLKALKGLSGGGACGAWGGACGPWMVFQ